MRRLGFGRGTWRSGFRRGRRRDGLVDPGLRRRGGGPVRLGLPLFLLVPGRAGSRAFLLRHRAQALRLHRRRLGPAPIARLGRGRLPGRDPALVEVAQRRGGLRLGVRFRLGEFDISANIVGRTCFRLGEPERGLFTWRRPREGLPPRRRADQAGHIERRGDQHRRHQAGRLPGERPEPVPRQPVLRGFREGGPGPGVETGREFLFALAQGGADLAAGRHAPRQLRLPLHAGLEPLALLRGEAAVNVVVERALLVLPLCHGHSNNCRRSSRARARRERTVPTGTPVISAISS